MRRLGSMSKASAWLAVLTLAGVSVSQEPEPIGYPGSMDCPDSRGAAAPRQDLYSTYTDAFVNPNAALMQNCDSQTAGEVNRLFKGPRYYKWIVAYDQIRWGRTKAGNEILTTTSTNIFDPPTFNADPDQKDLYGNPLNIPLPPSGLITVLNPNLPGVGIFVQPGQNPNSPFAPFDPFPNQRITEVLSPSQVRTQTDNFDHGREYGYRPKIGLEFEDGSRLTFSYYWLEDYQARISEDVSGASFFTTVISGGDDPLRGQYQRFGYISSPFNTGNPDFGGERRRQIGDDPSFSPHDPARESPPVLPEIDLPTTSRDVPREPTVNDFYALDALNGPENVNIGQSALWFDGEFMVADYDYNVFGAELIFEKYLSEWTKWNWKLWGIGGVKYVAMDEGFTFTFADIAPPGEIGNTGLSARSPFDRFAANNPLLPLVTQERAQPSIETVAITNVSVDNDIIGPCLGIHAVRPFAGFLEVDLVGRGTWGANFMQRDSYLIRGDGIPGFRRSKNSALSSGILECQLGINIVPWNGCKLRAGWEAMYLTSVGTAISNINYNLDVDSRPSNRDHVLWHGWYFGADVSF